MKKKTLRIIALVIALTLLLTASAFAAMTASEYINFTNAWITRDGNTVEVDFYIVGTSGSMDQIGVESIYLYEQVNNGWHCVAIYDSNDSQYHDILMGSNTGIKAGYVTYNGSANKHYYATCWFYAEKNGGSDTIPQNTPIS